MRRNGTEDTSSYRRACLECGEVFITRRKNKVYCCGKCCNRAWMKWHPRAKELACPKCGAMLSVAQSIRKANPKGETAARSVGDINEVSRHGE